MKKLLLLLALLGSGYLYAQPKEAGIIMGNVVENGTAKSLADVTILLTRHQDTSFSKARLTDRNGNFEFDHLPNGYYRLSISSMGYAPLMIDSIYVRMDRYDFNMPDITLATVAAQLAEVIVYAEKPLIENKDGIITYNVSESALSSGSSTAELLKNMPLVSNDPEGNILLKGREPKILIDEKPTELNAQQLADLLESMPGSSIEKIELMINPPPQYATEPGGVINIVTRKGKTGLIGRVTLSGGTRGEAKVASNISYRQKKITINTNAGYAINRFTGDRYSRRQNFYRDSTNYFNTDGGYANYSTRPNLRVQGNYDISTTQSFNAVLQSSFNIYDNESNTRYTNLDRFSEIYKLSTRRNLSTGENQSYSGNASYLYKSAITVEKLQIILAASKGFSDNERDFYQQYLFPDFTPTGEDSSQQQLFNNENHSYSLRVNYDKPMPVKGWTISSGVAYYHTGNHNRLATSFYNTALGKFVDNDVLSNDFRFSQQVYMARAGLNVRVKTWRLNAGVQAEQTATGFSFIKGNVADVANSYINWLPNASIRKEFSKQLHTSLAYRATIRRPGIRELNPNIDYANPYNIRFGNPYLLPTLSHSYAWELSFTRGRYYVNTSAGYNNITDVFNSISTLVENGVTEVTYLNIAGRQEYEASIWGGYTISKKLRINASAGFAINQYGLHEKTQYKYRDGESYYGSINYNYSPTSLLSFEGNARFSNFADPQGRARSNLTMNIGVQRKFFNKRLIVSINAIDPILTRKLVSYTYGSRFQSESFNSTNTRNFRLAVAYQINKVQQKKITEKQKAEMIKKIKTG